jgi:glycosyltransferase involved in cell wall biosynthesis
MKAGEKIRVLEVIQQGKIGGGESHLLTLIGQMDRSRYEPVVVALSDGEMIQRLTALGISNYVVNSPYPFNVRVWKRLTGILESERIDIVHTHGARALSNLIRPAARLGIPVVHTVHGWSFHDHLPAWKRRARIMGERYLTGKASMNIAVSGSNERIGKALFGAAFRCEVINNGVDLSVYAGERQANIRQEFGIAPDAVVISWVARFIHDKNPLPLIRAFARVLSSHPETRLVLVGDGPAREPAMRLAEELGVSGTVVFPGFRSDVPDILAASDIFVLPSIKEGLPVSLIEAMAMRNAVIATDVQGCIDVVTHEKDGLLVSLQGLEDGLTAALSQLLDDPAKRERLAEQGRATVEERFNATVMARKIEALYQKVLKL